MEGHKSECPYNITLRLAFWHESCVCTCAANVQYIVFVCVSSAGGRVSDQLSDRLIFGRLFQANEKFSTFQSCANL